MSKSKAKTQITLSRGKRRVFVFMTLAGGFILGLLIAEATLRIAGYSSPEFYMADDVRGYALIPNMTGTYRKEGKSNVEINSDGFRDIEHSVAKTAGVKRIAVIGDSYVEALQVERDESFARFMQSEIQTCGAFGGAQVEVLTFGVSGYGTAQEFLTLREKVFKYSPDLVMLLMTTNNDISDNTKFFKKTAIPYFEYSGGQLTLDESFRQYPSFVLRKSALSRVGLWFRNNVRVVQAVGEIQVAIKYKLHNWTESWQTADNSAAPDVAVPGPVAEPGIDSQIYRSPIDANWENAWSVTEGIIDVMNGEVGKSGAKFVVVTGSNGVQVLPEVETRFLFAKMLGVNDLFYPDRRIADFCKSRNIPIITLAPVLADYTQRENINIHGFEGNIGYGHWNQIGHRVAGAEIGKKICQGIEPQV